MMPGRGEPEPTSHRSSSRSGFTLVEVLVSITILAVVAIAIQRAVVIAVNGTARADRNVAAEMVARTLLTGPLGTGNDATKPNSGQMNGFYWTTRFAPLSRFLASTASDGSAPKWAPMQMTVTVARSPTGKPYIEVQTIRLIRIASQ